MFSSRFVRSLCLSFFFILMIGRRLAFGQPNFLYHFCINDSGNYTANSTYKANLDHLLSTLTTDHHIDYGFYNFSYGQDAKANAIGLCRGDATPENCRSCLNDAGTLLTLRCPNQKEAIGWYENCSLRYSDRSIFGFIDDAPALFLWNMNNASDQVRFTEVAKNFVQNLTVEAASGSSLLKFAAGNTTAPNLPTIYGFVQCTPDLSEKECNDCVNGALGDFGRCCYGREGGRVFRPSCSFRFEIYSFFGSTPEGSTPAWTRPSRPSPPQPQPQPSPSPTPLVSNRTADTEGKRSNRARTIVIIVVSIIVAVVAAVLIIGVCVFLRPRKPRTVTTKNLSEDEITNVESLHFDFNTIGTATNMFSEANKLGEGGFGVVYKGTLPNGQDIAVKRLSGSSTQGDVEFKNEVLLVAKLQHRNLVQLLGFCLKENEKLLIYEFVKNSSLEKFIFDPVKRASLNWERRYKIISGIARGLVYLHEDSRLRVIHRDLKASNILLDADMNAKIADFGTAKLFVPDQTQGDTSRIIGTFGYMAPEYITRGQFSVKSDVFSFGVLVLEIASGQKNNRDCNGEDVEDLISYVWRNWQEGRVANIVDPSLKSGSKTEMGRCIHIGLLCVQEDLTKRPTMAAILLMLNSHSITLPRPSEPAFFIISKTQITNMSSQWTVHDQYSQGTELESDQSKPLNSVQMSLNDASLSELYPR